jgi:hypothetical protein
MSDVALPAGILVKSMGIGKDSFDRPHGNPQTGAEQIQIMGPPMWTASLVSGQALTNKQSALWTKLVMSLRGRVNRIALWDLLKPAPRGTMRGVMTLAAPTLVGATSMTITAAGQASKTLLDADWLTVTNGGDVQLVSLMVDATSDVSGVITVTFEPALRVAYSAGTPVVWDKAYAMFRCTQNSVGWMQDGVTTSGYNLSFKESLVP